MATRNADSMTNAQGEFNPHRPRDEPLTTKGHQPGQKASPADHAPEFTAQTLPPGSAPASRTFQPNPPSTVPDQTTDDTVEGVGRTDALDMPGATSADVHTGLGHPGSGQTSTETRHGGFHTSKREGAGVTGRGEGGIGLRGEEPSTEFRQLRDDEHPSGPVSGHNVTLEGAEDKLPVSAEEVAAGRSGA